MNGTGGRPFWFGIGWAVLMLPICLSGCAVERWPIFQVDWEQELRDRPLALVAIPNALQPAAPEGTTRPTLTEAAPLALSVEQAVLLALENNRDLRVQQLVPVINRAFEQVERGVYDPELIADLTEGWQRATETSRATGEAFDVEAEDTTATAGIRQQLPTGTTLGLEASGERQSSNRTEDQLEARVGLTVTQSLLRGFGPAVNLASVRQAELATLASVYELRGFIEALVAETERTYWLYALALREIAIFEQSLELAREQRFQTRQRIDVGQTPRSDAAAAEAEVALREQALIDARSELETQRLQLLRLTSPHVTGTLEQAIQTTSSIESPASPLEELEERLALALRMRPELNEARLQLEQDRLEVIQTRNGLLPRLDLFMTLGRSGYAASFSDAVRDLGDGGSYDLVVGGSFSHFLGNRAAGGRHAAALATAQQASAALANLAQIVQLDVRLAATQVERARQQITATAATRTLREETLRAEQERFQVGTSTNLLVSLAQRDLLESQIAEVEATVGYRLALIDLYLAEGSLLERRGIRAAGDPRRNR